ncbi:MAG: hypothetical protein AAB268_12125, partial [Elusimicrobiota bacterium]
DYAGNNWTRNQTPTVTYDASEPTAGIQVPVSGGFYNTLATISGTSVDNVVVSTIALSIQDVSIAAPNCYSEASGLFDADCPPDTDGWFPAKGTVGAWTYSGITWTALHQYIVTARATDPAGNVQSVFALHTSSNPFTYVTTAQAPTAGILNPNAARQNNLLSAGLTTISGTAAVNEPNKLAIVEVRVQQAEELEYYWNPVNQQFELDPVTQAELAWTTAAYVTDWTNWTLSSAVVYEDGAQYRVIARARDRAGNYVVNYTTKTVIYDATAPLTYVASPGNGSVINSLTISSGTKVDQTGNGQNLGTVGDVQVRFKRLSGTPSCWNGAAWLGCPQTMAPPTNIQVWESSWTINPTKLPGYTDANDLTSGTSYYITSSGTDNAAPTGNVEAFDSIYGSTFVYNADPPVSSIAAPLSGA